MENLTLNHTTEDRISNLGIPRITFLQWVLVQVLIVPLLLLALLFRSNRVLEVYLLVRHLSTIITSRLRERVKVLTQYLATMPTIALFNNYSLDPNSHTLHVTMAPYRSLVIHLVFSNLFVALLTSFHISTLFVQETVEFYLDRWESSLCHCRLLRDIPQDTTHPPPGSSLVVRLLLRLTLLLFEIRQRSFNHLGRAMYRTLVVKLRTAQVRYFVLLTIRNRLHLNLGSLLQRHGNTVSSTRQWLLLPPWAEFGTDTRTASRTRPSTTTTTVVRTPVTLPSLRPLPMLAFLQSRNTNSTSEAAAAA